MLEPLSIIYRDDYMVAINKPSGLLVHRSNIDRHETRFALQLLRDQLGQYVYPVHRLDKPTSGLLIFALSSDIAKTLSSEFSNQNIEKTYLAIVRGWCEERGTVDHPLKEQFDKMSGKQKIDQVPAKDAITHFKRLATVELPFEVDRYPKSRYSLVEAYPVNGRKHQIRRHFKHISHPVIGDAKHGKSLHNRFFQSQFNCHRLMLACTQMKLTHPLTGEPITLNAPLDATFCHVIHNLGWAAP
jgi:tRNA pseudouridine65 synthase